MTVPGPIMSIKPTKTTAEKVALEMKMKMLVRYFIASDRGARQSTSRISAPMVGIAFTAAATVSPALMARRTCSAQGRIAMVVDDPALTNSSKGTWRMNRGYSQKDHHEARKKV